MCADMEQESMEQERRRIHVCHMGRRICVLTWSNRTSRAIHQNAHTHTHTHTHTGWVQTSITRISKAIPRSTVLSRRFSDI